MRTFYTSLIILIFSTIWGSCNPKSHAQDQELKEYDLRKPDEFNMPESLFEISGIAFNQGRSDTIYAIQDEEGKLFRLPWNVKTQYHTKFGKKGDYEDVTILRNQVYVLKSNGHIFSFPLSQAAWDEPTDVKEFDKILPKGEYEGMFGDEKSGQIFVICKSCADDNSKKLVSGFVLNPEVNLSTVQKFGINVKEIEDFTKKSGKGFKPSGLALNPITNEWYIISAVNKLLVVADKNWKVKGAYHLGGEAFTQPEGIAFDKLGNLYISNEGDDISEGNILKFLRLK